MEGMIWLALLIVLVVIEILTLGLTTIWFAGGALAAFVASLLGAGVPLQILLFVVVSLLLLLGTRPFAVKYFNKDRVKTNAESLIGTCGIVQEAIDNRRAAGRVMVNGMEWSARSADDTRIAEGTEVQIEEISGVKLIVREKNS